MAAILFMVVAEILYGDYLVAANLGSYYSVLAVLGGDSFYDDGGDSSL